jgi:hypothetical protein
MPQTKSSNLIIHFFFSIVKSGFQRTNILPKTISSVVLLNVQRKSFVHDTVSISENLNGLYTVQVKRKFSKKLDDRITLS